MRNLRDRQTRTHRYALPGAFALLLAGTAVITLSLQGVDIFGLVAAATSSLSRAPVTLYLTPYDDQELRVGEAKKIDVIVNAKVPINAVGTTIKFPQDAIDILGFSKEKSFFDLWTEETAIDEDAGEIHFSGGTTVSGGLMGTGTILTFTVRPKKSGASSLYFKESQTYSADGKGTIVDDDTRSLTFDVQPAPTPTPSQTYVNNSSASQPDKPLPRSADLNSDGYVNLIDMSIMVIHLMAPYDQRYDLNMDGAINFSDLSILLSKMR